MNSEKVKLTTLNINHVLGQKVKIYCANKNLKIRDAVEAALELYMNSNQSPTSFSPTPHQQSIVDSAKYPYAAPKKNNGEEVVGTTAAGEDIVFESLGPVEEA
jgi:hypothetical protein